VPPDRKTPKPVDKLTQSERTSSLPEGTKSEGTKSEGTKRVSKYGHHKDARAADVTPKPAKTPAKTTKSNILASGDSLEQAFEQAIEQDDRAIGNVLSTQERAREKRLMAAGPRDVQVRLEAINAIRDDRTRLIALNDLAWSLLSEGDQHLEYALILAQRAKHLAESLRDTSGLAHSLRTIGIGEAAKHDYKNATQTLLMAYKLAQRNADKHTEMQVLRSLANSYFNLGDYTLALAHSLEILELARRLNDKHDEAYAFNVICKTQITIGSYHEALDNALRNLELLEAIDASFEDAFLCYTNLGLTHRYLESFDRAHYFFQKSLTEAEQGGAPCLQAEALANIADTYNMQNEYALAFDMLDSARDVLEGCNDVTVAARTLISSGVTLINEGNLDAALRMLQRSLSLLEQTPHVHHQIWALEHLGEVHLKKKDYPLALHYFMQVLNLAEVSGSKKYIYQVHYWFSRLYEATGDMSKALEHYKLFNQVKEEVLSQVNAHKLRSTVIQFDLERAERDKEIHKRNNHAIMQAYEDLDKAKRDAEEALAARTAILESIADGFISLTERLMFRYLNSVAVTYFNKKASQLLGRNLWQEMPELAEYKRTFEQVLLDQQAKQFEFKVKQGTWLEVRLFPTDGGVSMYFRDITERKKAEVDREHYVKLVQIEHGRAEERLKEAERLQLELDRKNRELVRLSVQDGLTKLYNRRYLDDFLGNEFASVKRYGQPLAVLLCDIDHFKQINDNYSHAIGDEVLRHIAKIFQKQTRETDLVARYGGEEFVMVFTNTVLEQACQAADKIREQVQDYAWHDIHPELQVTMSGGVCADTSFETYEQMLSVADEFLYSAKENGRNQIHC
jgi:diguanylate cyclase (GGDEF)-like protein/PAS domain S-box-containing protein